MNGDDIVRRLQTVPLRRQGRCGGGCMDQSGPCWRGCGAAADHHAGASHLNFTIDFVPGYPQIIVLRGAAHAFKFAALIGQIAVDLAVRGETSYPIGAFAADRAALTDSAFELALHL